MPKLDKSFHIRVQFQLIHAAEYTEQCHTYQYLNITFYFHINCTCPWKSRLLRISHQMELQIFPLFPDVTPSLGLQSQKPKLNWVVSPMQEIPQIHMHTLESTAKS